MPRPEWSPETLCVHISIICWPLNNLKTGFLVKSCSHFLCFCCRQNYEIHKCKQILLFQKHSPLHNQFWKQVIFFIFVYDHFSCKVMILTSPKSVNKNKVLNFFLWIYLVNDNYTCCFFLFKCKFCSNIFDLIHFSDLLYAIFHFYTHKIFYFGSCWHAQSCLWMLTVKTHFVCWLVCW